MKPSRKLHMRISSIAVLSALTLLASVALPSKVYADSFTASYLAAGAQTPGSITGNVNTFEPATYNASSNTTTFNGSGITGTYSGNFSSSAANQYGGAGGTGNFLTTSSSYTLSLSSSANYFGLWFSALDAGNQLSFYNDSSLLYTFTPTLYQSLVGACPNANNAFCGNPNSAFAGQDGGEQFAYLNVYDTNGTFNRIVFTEVGGNGGFESDNHAVALTSQPASLGTAIVTPEPSSWILALTGIGAIVGVVSLRRA